VRLYPTKSPSDEKKSEERDRQGDPKRKRANGSVRGRSFASDEAERDRQAYEDRNERDEDDEPHDRVPLMRLELFLV
jgi:hypothetical protein